MHTSSVAPGYTVDSKTTIAPRVRFWPTEVLAPTSGPKSGLCASSTGVGDDDEIGFAQCARIGRHLESGGRLELRGADFAGGIELPAVGLDLLLRQVEAYGAVNLSELDRERQAYIAEADDGDGGH